MTSSPDIFTYWELCNIPFSCLKKEVKQDPKTVLAKGVENENFRFLLYRQEV